MCVCVCVCVHIYIYIYVYLLAKAMFIYVDMCIFHCILLQSTVLYLQILPYSFLTYCFLVKCTLLYHSPSHRALLYSTLSFYVVRHVNNDVIMLQDWVICKLHYKDI